MNIGVLALQGNFSSHSSCLRELGASVLEIRKADALSAVDGLVLPGGESTTMLRLMTPQFREELIRVIRSGLPVLATCAGVILLAKEVRKPCQESFDVLDVDVERNGYGRQIDSFKTDSLELTQAGRELLQFTESRSIDGVFIRAPIITRIGEAVEVLANQNGTPVLVKDHNLIAATFHPELGRQPSAVHQLFVEQCAKSHCR